MKYEIKDFQNVDGKKFVGLWVVDDEGRRLAIDKHLPLVDGKSNEQYVQEAVALCQAEISEWQSRFELVGKTWNPETNSFE